MRNRHKTSGPGRHCSLAGALSAEVNKDPKMVFVSPDDKTSAELETNSKTSKHNLGQFLLSWHGQVIVIQPGLRPGTEAVATLNPGQKVPGTVFLAVSKMINNCSPPPSLIPNTLPYHPTITTQPPHQRVPQHLPVDSELCCSGKCFWSRTGPWLWSSQA